VIDPSDLYGLPLERFTKERNALVKELRRDGRRDEAERVSKLRKPSQAAWAVNQLVRTQGREVKALFKAGDALQKAQGDLLGGKGNPSALRKAVDAERTAAERLLERARGLLSSEGNDLTPARLEQVSETLHAAAHDEEARDRLRDGCLERELRHLGLGALGAAGPEVPKPKRAAAPDRSSERREARQAEAEARRRMERAARGVQVAEERLDRATEQLREAEEKLGAARQQAEEAIATHRQAERALDGL
jgi:hypothetical protein